MPPDVDGAIVLSHLDALTEAFYRTRLALADLVRKRGQAA
jgi:hypothetical protein